MINIIVFCNPNYTNKKIINTITKNISIIDQFIFLYKSIKKNWKKIKYNITVIHNIDFNFSDLNKLSNLDIDIIKCEPDFIELPFQNRCACLTQKMKQEGTHRLVLDCDMLALNEPDFDLSCDWQCMFAGKINIEKKYIDYIINEFNYKYIDYIINEFNYKFIDNNYEQNNLFNNYILNKINYKKIYPYFNAGALLIKEQYCNKFVSLWKPTLKLGLQKYWKIKNVPENVLHIALQYSFSYALLDTSNNWKPLKPGINYLLKIYDPHKFGLNNISLLHYCGIGAGEIAQKLLPEYFI
jgi:hypothetical protein